MASSTLEGFPPREFLWRPRFPCRDVRLGAVACVAARYVAAVRRGGAAARRFVCRVVASVWVCFRVLCTFPRFHLKDAEATFEVHPAVRSNVCFYPPIVAFPLFGQACSYFVVDARARYLFVFRN